MQFATNLLTLGLALAATSAWAAPAVNMRQDQPLYKLQISNPEDESLDGQWVVSDGENLGVFVENKDPITVYTLTNDKGLMELHTYPVGIVDHALGLEGPPGLLTFVEMVDPKGEKGDDGIVRTWDTFRLAEDEKLVNDGDGKWYAFPTGEDGWIVKWYDNSVGAGVTDNYVIVEIVMKKVDEDSYRSVE